MKNYLLANVRLHHFKSLGYRKLANICKCMQIRKPFEQQQKNCFLYKFLGKVTSPQTVFFPNFQFSLLFDPTYCAGTVPYPGTSKEFFNQSYTFIFNFSRDNCLKIKNNSQLKKLFVTFSEMITHFRNIWLFVFAFRNNITEYPWKCFPC